MHNWVGEGQEYNPEEAKDWGQCLSPLVVRLGPLALLLAPQESTKTPGTGVVQGEARSRM